MVRTDLSDRHRSGQTVTELILKSGSRIIYKPRTVRPEQVFYAFLRRLTLEDLSLSLRILTAVDRGSYGWCEVAIPSACDSLEGIARFYRRAGMLLAVLHLLAVADIHCENVVAAGEHPVVVDLETMLTAMVPGGSFAWSVLSTGLLPRWQTAPDGHHFDLSGLGADGTHDAGIQRRAWMRVNTDQMHLSDPLAVRASTNHCPAFADTRATAGDYSRDITAGFEEMYAHLMVSRDKLINDRVLLAMFDDLELRTLLRSTATYARLQLRLLHPEFMTSGIDRSIELEWLSRPLTGPASDKRDRQRIYDHERDAMEKLDVPSFTTSFADLVSHESADQDLALLCARRNGSLVRERLGHLSVEDCRQQVEAIEQAMRDRYTSPVVDTNT